ncbi:MAG: energy-coupled thiamine transporter ThiT [Oscillospiraceae bacterium]|nr:energy-coupled thiamine transporter ThiT [Oscillospiraceae bacterium]
MSDTTANNTPTSHAKIVRLAASGIMIALATVLSMITIVKMPLGGSLTPVSMLPICMIAVIYGTKWGLGTAFAYSLVQLIIDFSSALSWGLTVPALIACFVFDYLLAFTMLGFAGIFRRQKGWGIPVGVGVAVLLRYICHIISGGTVFAIWMPEGWGNPWIYSMAYNGAFMGPELVLTVIAALALSRVPVLRRMIEE